MPTFVPGTMDVPTARAGSRKLILFFVMTTEFFNANVQIVNVRNVVFRKNSICTYYFSNGFAFFVPGFGYLKFKKDNQPYVLGAKKWLKAILDAGGFITMDDVEFIPAVN